MESTVTDNHYGKVTYRKYIRKVQGETKTGQVKVIRKVSKEL